MTKNWCNRFPPNVRTLRANRMTEVRCKNTTTRHRREVKERNIRWTKVREEKTLTRQYLQVLQVYFMSEFLFSMRWGRHTYACQDDKVQRIMTYPTNMGLSYIVHASINMSQIKNIMDPTYILFLGQ